MLRNWMLGLLLILAANSQAFAQQAFVAGVDYKIIPTAVKTSDPDKVVVTEMFWYGCPHCFRFEPFVEQWSASLPAGVVFEQIPSTLNPRWGDHARTFFSLKVMGELDNYHRAFFDGIHVKRKRLDRLDAIAEYLGDRGLDEAKFRETFNSFPVDTEMRKNAKKERKYGHNGVPAVIINGKYQTSGSMAGSNQRLIQVMNFLVAKELAEQN